MNEGLGDQTGELVEVEPGYFRGKAEVLPLDEDFVDKFGRRPSLRRMLNGMMRAEREGRPLTDTDLFGPPREIEEAVFETGSGDGVPLRDREPFLTPAFIQKFGRSSGVRSVLIEIYKEQRRFG